MVDFGSRATRTVLAARAPTTTTTNLVYERPEPFSGDFPTEKDVGSRLKPIANSSSVIYDIQHCKKSHAGT